MPAAAFQNEAVKLAGETRRECFCFDDSIYSSMTIVDLQVTGNQQLTTAKHDIRVLKCFESIQNIYNVQFSSVDVDVSICHMSYDDISVSRWTYLLACLLTYLLACLLTYLLVVDRQVPTSVLPGDVLNITFKSTHQLVHDPKGKR